RSLVLSTTETTGWRPIGVRVCPFRVTVSLLRLLSRHLSALANVRSQRRFAMRTTAFFAVLLVAALASAQTVERVAYDYTAMYEALNPSIVKVHSDSGTGSGFLVVQNGMIATNHH